MNTWKMHRSWRLRSAQNGARGCLSMSSSSLKRTAGAIVLTKQLRLCAAPRS